MLDLTSLPTHLAVLDDRWEKTLEALGEADARRRDALYTQQKAYATAFVNAQTAASAEALRKQHAILATLDEARELERWESEVRFLRDQLRALSERTALARSLWAGVRGAVS